LFGRASIVQLLLFGSLFGRGFHLSFTLDYPRPQNFALRIGRITPAQIHVKFDRYGFDVWKACFSRSVGAPCAERKS
jgi:hypothetical protein